MPTVNGAATATGTGTATAAGAYGAPAAATATGTGTAALTAVIPTLGAATATGASTVTVAGGRLVSWALLTTTARAAARIKQPPSGTGRRIVITNTDLTKVCELPAAELGDLHITLNGIDEWTFKLDVHDTQAAELLGDANYFREAQYWRGDQLLCWGPIVDLTLDGDTLTAYCKGALWHLTRRHVGDLDRTNYLDNGDFEEGLTAWNIAKTDTISGIPTFATPNGLEALITRTTVKDGSRALQLLDNTSAPPTDYQEPFLWQEFDVTSGPLPLEVTLIGWVYLPSAYFTEANQRSTGLLIARLPTGYTGEGTSTPTGWYTDLYEAQWSTIDATTPQDTWVRQSVTITVPANSTETIHCRLTTPRGRCYWDRVSAVVNDYLHYTNTDQATIIAGLVAHAQDGAAGKSDVNIDTITPATGVTRTETWYYADHRNIWQAISDIVAATNGVDVRAIYTADQRFLATGYPQHGTHRTGIRLDIDGTGANATSLSWSHKGSEAATVVVGLGDDGGGGADREEAVATDTTLFDGLTLEEVFSAPTGTPVDVLDEITTERLAVLKSPETFTATLPADQVIGQLLVGDSIDVAICWGELTVTGEYRIVDLVLDRHDWARLTFNRRAL